MNRKQEKIMWVGIALIVLMGIFPPLLITGSASDLFIGYGFISAPSVCKNLPKAAYAKVDFTRLLTQWTIVVAITAGMIITFKDKNPKDEQKQ